MNYYTIYEKLLISLYFLCHLFFLQNKKYFSFMQVFGLFLLCFHEKRLILPMNGFIDIRIVSFNRIK